MSYLSEGVCVCVWKRSREREREVTNGRADTVCEVRIFWTSFTSYQHTLWSMLIMKSLRKFTDTLFQLNTVREHDNHEVIWGGV